MADRLTPEQRHKNMQHVRNKDSEIELLLRKELWRRGLRYRKNVKSIPRCPDIAFKKLKIAVFCDSEFWHGFDWENRKSDIKTNRDFWIKKIERISPGIKKNLSECADTIERKVKEKRKCLTEQ